MPYSKLRQVILQTLLSHPLRIYFPMSHREWQGRAQSCTGCPSLPNGQSVTCPGGCPSSDSAEGTDPPQHKLAHSSHRTPQTRSLTSVASGDRQLDRVWEFGPRTHKHPSRSTLPANSWVLTLSTLLIQIFRFIFHQTEIEALLTLFKT